MYDVDESGLLKCGLRPSVSVLRVSGELGVNDFRETLNRCLIYLQQQEHSGVLVCISDVNLINRILFIKGLESELLFDPVPLGGGIQPVEEFLFVGHTWYTYRNVAEGSG